MATSWVSATAGWPSMVTRVGAAGSNQTWSSSTIRSPQCSGPEETTKCLSAAVPIDQRPCSSGARATRLSQPCGSVRRAIRRAFQSSNSAFQTASSVVRAVSTSGRSSSEKLKVQALRLRARPAARIGAAFPRRRVDRSGASIDVLQTFDIVFTEIGPGLYLDDFSRLLPPIFQAVQTAGRDLDGLARLEIEFLVVQAHAGRTANNGPVLAAMRVLLQRQHASGAYDQAFDLAVLGVLEHGEAAP